MPAREDRTVYRIEVHGEMSPRFAQVFDTLAVERAGGRSSLVVSIRDDSELQGMLALLAALGIAVLSVVPGP